MIDLFLVGERDLECFDLTVITTSSPRPCFEILPAVQTDALLVGERHFEGFDLTLITVIFFHRDRHDNHGIITNTIHHEVKTFPMPSCVKLERNFLLNLAVNIKACGTMISELL